eukprot:GHVS01003732.1.p1 GENE.GHVS01003732.1~~GHVS01003732.1.p1  ORF type:complete len:358 (-),score=37.34 GHVS01003732.1:498-1454(-)
MATRLLTRHLPYVSPLVHLFHNNNRRCPYCDGTSSDCRAMLEGAVESAGRVHQWCGRVVLQLLRAGWHVSWRTLRLASWAGLSSILVAIRRRAAECCGGAQWLAALLPPRGCAALLRTCCRGAYSNGEVFAIQLAVTLLDVVYEYDKLIDRTSDNGPGDVVDESYRGAQPSIGPAGQVVAAWHRPSCSDTLLAPKHFAMTMTYSVFPLLPTLFSRLTTSPCNIYCLTISYTLTLVRCQSTPFIAHLHQPIHRTWLFNTSQPRQLSGPCCTAFMLGFLTSLASWSAHATFAPLRPLAFPSATTLPFHPPAWPAASPQPS